MRSICSAHSERIYGKETGSWRVQPGIIPTIACFNKATVPLGVNLEDLIAAMQVYVDKYVAPVWGTPAKLIETNGFQKGSWAIVFLDDADQPGALAYHDL